jgi:L-asparaginase II
MNQAQPGPVLVEVLRGGWVESRHHGALAVSDADGAILLALGDIDAPVFPRSAVKAFQALPLVESGAADRYRLTEAEIALAIASHSGEPQHVETARAMLAKCGREPDALECGAHWPANLEAGRALAAAGKAPSALHNNCSGKHAGFVCLACAAGVEPSGYVGPEHFVQREVARSLAEMTGAPIDGRHRAIDGCAIPTYAIPLVSLARAFARFGVGRGMSATRAAAANRIRAAAAAHPEFVGGAGRFDTIVMQILGKRAFVKTGAEGVYCAAFPERGLGVAIKCWDGASRAAEVAMGAMITRFVPMSPIERVVLEPRFAPVLTNWNGAVVGEMRAAAGLGATR